MSGNLHRWTNKARLDPRFIRGLSAVYQRDGTRSSFLAVDQCTDAHLPLYTVLVQGKSGNPNVQFTSARKPLLRGNNDAHAFWLLISVPFSILKKKLFENSLCSN